MMLCKSYWHGGDSFRCIEEIDMLLTYKICPSLSILKVKSS